MATMVGRKIREYEAPPLLLKLGARAEAYLSYPLVRLLFYRKKTDVYGIMLLRSIKCSAYPSLYLTLPVQLWIGASTLNIPSQPKN